MPLGLPFNINEDQGSYSVNSQGFGFILIDGPSGVVSSLDKRDGSDYNFLSCPIGTDRQTVRVFCNSKLLQSNCHLIHEDGVGGTIIKLPADCGPGLYAVAHDLTLSENQLLPRTTEVEVLANRTVLDLELSYNFGLIKRDAGRDLYVRIDYTNLPGYWKSIVDSPGESTQTSRFNKRFFSSSGSSWKSSTYLFFQILEILS